MSAHITKEEALSIPVIKRFYHDMKDAMLTVSGSWHHRFDDPASASDPFRIRQMVQYESIITGFDLHHWRFKLLVDGELALQCGVCSLDEMQATIHRWISHKAGLLDDVERTHDLVLPVFAPRVNA